MNLLICQKSKIEDWLDHFNTYYPDILAFNLTDSNEFADFIQCQEHSNEFMYVGIINYELTYRRSRVFGKLHPGFTLMLDESSLIQNETTKRAKFVLKLKPSAVILLSGTPTSGKYEKLWSQLKLLGWNISKRLYWNSYVETEWIDVGAFKQEIVTGYRNVEHLKRRLREHGAVFLKTEEVLELPEQITQIIKVNNTKEYQKFKKDSYLLMANGVELIGDNSLSKMLYERQLCGLYSKDKLKAFADLLDDTEERLVVFYNFTTELVLMLSVCDRIKKPVSIVNGKTKDLTAYEERENSVTFVQYQAGAMGLNLQKANRIIYFTLPLGKGSCGMWEQSKKRIHRIGQKHTCFYYYLIVENSIEELNLKQLQHGKELTDELFKKSETA